MKVASESGGELNVMEIEAYSCASIYKMSGAMELRDVKSVKWGSGK